MELAFNALTILEEVKDYGAMATVQETIGTIYLEQRQYHKTLNYYSLAYFYFQKILDYSGMARVIGNKGIVLNEKGKYLKALNCHFLALKNNQLKGSRRSEQINLANIGISYGHLKKHKDALKYHLLALNISRQIKDKTSIAVNLGNAGEVYLTLAMLPENHKLKNKYLQNGISFLKEATNICREINFRGPLVEFSKSLSDAYLAAGRYNLSLDEYKTYARVKDSVFAAETQTEIASLETKREMEIKDKEFAIKKMQKEILILEIRNNKYQKVIYLIGLVLLLLIIVLMYYFAHNRAKSHSKVLGDIAHYQSHEVRAPLARIMGLISVIDYEDHTNENNKQFLSYIKSAATDLDKVIESVVNKTSEDQNTGSGNNNFIKKYLSGFSSRG